MKQQAVVIVDSTTVELELVDLPDGHAWNNLHPKSKWGISQVCLECKIKISWSKDKWRVHRPRKWNGIPSCEEVKMEEALE